MRDAVVEAQAAARARGENTAYVIGKVADALLFGAVAPYETLALLQETGVDL